MMAVRINACFLLIFVALSFAGGDVFGQMNRRSIKKNNRKISSFKGKKFGFSKEKRYNTVGFTLNALNYFGDLSPMPSRLSTDFGFTRPAIGLNFTHRFGPRYTLQGAFNYGTLKGGDSDSADPNKTESVYRYVRNVSFRNRIQELTVVAMFDFYQNQSTYMSRARWTPYAFAGLTVFHHNPKGKAPAKDLNGQALPQAGKWVALQPLGTEGQFSALAPDAMNAGIKPYKRIQLAIPIGIGARFRINQIVDFSFDFSFRYLFTDYIDDVSRNYVDLNELNSELAKAMSYRSNEVVSTNENVMRVINNRSTYNGYTVVAGFGQEHPDNMRGNKKDRDFYTVTTFRLTSIIGKSFHRAKFR